MIYNDIYIYNHIIYICIIYSILYTVSKHNMHGIAKSESHYISPQFLRAYDVHLCPGIVKHASFFAATAEFPCGQFLAGFGSVDLIYLQNVYRICG